MCKLYAIQRELTRKAAADILKEKIGIIRKTESQGLGVAIHADGKTVSWKCGSFILDHEGENPLCLLDDKPKMATIVIHGRTSTSKDTSVNHAHPRPSSVGLLMHNGHVSPKEGSTWTAEYSLDSDYLAELASFGKLDVADEYLDGYAAILLLQNDGTLVVQNQGASLYMNLKHSEVEFGTTFDLCRMGNRFEDMRAEVYETTLWSRPINGMSGRGKSMWKSQTDKTTSTSSEPEKKIQHHENCKCPQHTTSGADTQEIPKLVSGRTPEEQKRRNKKGRRNNSHYLEGEVRGKMIHIGEKWIGIDEFIESLDRKEEEDNMEIQRAFADAKKDASNA